MKSWGNRANDFFLPFFIAVFIFLPNEILAQFYDDCGNPTEQPHLIQGISYNDWEDIDPTSTESQKSVNYHPERVIYSYSGLDPLLDYKITLTYLQESRGNRIQRLEANRVMIHPDLLIPDFQAEQFTFILPKETYNDGRLLLNFIKVFGPNAVVSEISIEETTLAGVLEGVVHVADQAEQFLARALISVSGYTTLSGQDGSYRFEHMPIGEQTLTVSLTAFDHYQEKLQLTSNDLVYDIPLQNSTYGSLAGIILDAVSLERLSGVAIKVSPLAVASSDALMRNGISDTDGGYSISSLPIGSYRLEATLAGYQTFNQDIDLVEGDNTVNVILSSSTTPLDEQEPNNNLAIAENIILGQTITGYINPVGDTDFFQLHADTGHLIVSLGNVPVGLELNLAILDSTGQEITSFTGNEGVIFNLETNLDASAMYYISIHDNQNDESSTEPYTFTASLLLGDVFEPNNISRDSSLLGLVKPYYPTILPDGDVDYFHFHIADAGIINISLTNIPASLNLRAILYSDDQTEIWQRTTGVGGAINYDISLNKKGSYLLKIEDVGGQSAYSTYRLLLTQIASADEHEPNDTFASATPITLGSPLGASIYPVGDQDYFRTELDNSGRLIVELQQVPATIRPNIWIFNEQQDQLATTFANTAGISLTYGIVIEDTGHYFIKVADYQNQQQSLENYQIVIYRQDLWIEQLSVPNSFSPNGDSLADSLTISTVISHLYPLDHWGLTISDSLGNPVRSYSGITETVEVIWDGMNEVGELVAEGEYIIRLEVWDDQGGSFTSANSIIRLDSSFPTASITTPIENEFLQNTIGIIGTVQDDDFAFATLSYGQGTSPTVWEQLAVFQSPVVGTTLYTWNLDDIEDGVYTLKLSVSDNSGNVSTVLRTVEVDRVIFSNLNVHPKSINQVTNESTTLYFTLDKEMEVSVNILGPDSSVGKTLHLNTLMGTGAHAIEWDGKDESGEQVVDEAYFFDLQARYPGTEQFITYSFGTSEIPYINNITDCENFNPAINENCTISYNLTTNAKVLLRVGLSGATSPLRTLLNWVPRSSGYNGELWDGRRDDGSMIAAGDYLIGAWVTALPDNAVITTGNLLRFTSLNVLPSVITPSFGEICTLTYQITKDATLTIEIQDQANITVKTLALDDIQTVGQHSFIWDGRDEEGKIVCQEGIYDLTFRIKLTAVGAGGNTVIAYANIHVANQ